MSSPAVPGAGGFRFTYRHGHATQSGASILDSRATKLEDQASFDGSVVGDFDLGFFIGGIDVDQPDLIVTITDPLDRRAMCADTTAMFPKSCAILAVVIGATLLNGCSKEARTLAPEQPQTPPDGSNDPRAALFDKNALQVSQGGRYFTWYGCGECHASGARGQLDLADGRWIHGSAVDQVYASIADRHARNYRRLIPTQQLWQLTAYARSLPALDPALRRREDADARGEPSANSWGGALR